MRVRLKHPNMIYKVLCPIVCVNGRGFEFTIVRICYNLFGEQGFITTLVRSSKPFLPHAASNLSFHYFLQLLFPVLIFYVNPFRFICGGHVGVFLLLLFFYPFYRKAFSSSELKLFSPTLAFGWLEWWGSLLDLSKLSSKGRPLATPWHAKPLSVLLLLPLIRQTVIGQQVVHFGSCHHYRCCSPSWQEGYPNYSFEVDWCSWFDFMFLP